MEKSEKIRSRIKSISGTQKITKAMEMIASSKIRKAQARVLEARSFTFSIEEIIADIACFSGFISDPLLTPPQKDEVYLILAITGDRGLCGGYNSNIIRLIERTIKQLANADKQVKIIMIGTKGKNYFKYMGYELEKIYENLSDYPKFLDAREISREIIKQYLEGDADKVLVCYTMFKNPAEHIPTIIQLLPIPIYAQDYLSESINESFFQAGDEVSNKKTARLETDKGLNNKNTFSSKISNKELNLNLSVTENKKYLQEKIISIGEVKIGEKVCRIHPEFIYDPSHQEVLSALLPEYIYTIVYSALLESSASETGARMTAMKSASENAEEMIKELVLMYHRARQQQITMEISEIISGANALD